MLFFQKKVAFLVAVLLFSFFFVTVERHSDHDLNAKAPAHHCCVQCCPTHNLAPLGENANSLVRSTSERQVLSDAFDFHPEIYLNQIYRPPIV